MIKAPRRSILAIIFGLFLAASLLLVYSSSDSAQATGNYEPTFSAKICNILPESFPDPELNGPATPCTNPIPSTSAARTLGVDYEIPNGDLQFSSLNLFEPNGVDITPGCNIDTDADDILDGRDFDGNGTDDVAGDCLRPGDKVGGLRNLVSLGFLNGPCEQNGNTVDFVLYNIALPDDAANPRNSTNIYTPAAEGTSSGTRFSTAGGQVPGTGYVDVVLANGSPGTDTIADVDPDDPTNDSVSSQAITNYPDWLLDIFDPDWLPVNPPVEGPKDEVSATPGTDDRQNAVDGPKKPLIPLVVYGGISSVGGSKTPLYFVQFEDGVLSDEDNSDGFAAPHPFNVAEAALGQPYTTILTDTTPIVIGTSPVTDFCTSLLTKIMLLGTTATDSATRATNPSTAGSHPGLVWTASARDLDNDGYGSGIDTCPKETNTDTDPRNEVDPDGDMIDAGNIITGTAESSTVSTLFDDTPSATPFGSNDSQVDRWITITGGTGSGQSRSISTNTGDTVTVSSNWTTNPDDTSDYSISCDPDVPNQGCGVGFINAEAGDDCDDDDFQNALDNCPLVANPDQIQSELLAAYSSSAPDGGPKSDGIGDDCETGFWSGTQNGVAGTTITLSSTVANGHYHVKGYVMPVCYGGTDDDGDGWCLGAGESDTSALEHPNLATLTSNPTGDHDGDGTNAWVETFMGIDDAQACSGDTTTNNEPLQSLSWDLNDDTSTSVLDINIMKPTFFTNQVTGGAYTVRNDLNADTTISVLDINIMKPHFFTGCAPHVQQ